MSNDEPTEALFVTCASGFAEASLSAASHRIGEALAADTGGGLVWAEVRTTKTTSRVFALPADLQRTIGAATVELAGDFTASIGLCKLSVPTLHGPGAIFWAVQQDNPSIRRQLPPLPPGWAQAIARAAVSGEPLVQGSVTMNYVRGYEAGLAAARKPAAMSPNTLRSTTQAARPSTATSFAAGEVIRECDVVRSDRVPDGHYVHLQDGRSGKVQLRNGRWVAV
jgi:hypothetical protein